MKYWRQISCVNIDSYENLSNVSLPQVCVNCLAYDPHCGQDFALKK